MSITAQWRGDVTIFSDRPAKSEATVWYNPETNTLGVLYADNDEPAGSHFISGDGGPVMDHVWTSYDPDLRQWGYLPIGEL